MLGKEVFACLTGADCLVPIHRSGPCLFAGESSPVPGRRACEMISQGDGVSGLQLLHTALCNA